MTRRPRKAKATRKAPRKHRKVTRAAKPKPLDGFISAAARALDLKIDDAWMPTVRRNLQLDLRHGATVIEFALSDDTEPAPVFKA